MDITKGQGVMIQEWLNSKDKILQKEKNPLIWSKVNSGYVGVLKFLSEIKVEVIYRKKEHSVRVNKVAIPEELDISKYTTNQIEQIADLLKTINIYPEFKNNKFIFKYCNLN